MDTINEILPPLCYTILNYGDSYHVMNGKYAGQFRNMYWKVKENLSTSSTDINDNSFYIMHIKDEIYTKISNQNINQVLNYKNTRPSWYLQSNGYIATTMRHDRTQIYLHQLIMDVHDEDLTNFEKTVDHINNDKLDNRRENL